MWRLLLSCLGLFVWFHNRCIVTAFTVESRPLLTRDELYYEYVPDRLPWHDAVHLCNQRSGSLATVSTSAENQQLTRFLLSLNISYPVWIAKKVTTRNISVLTTHVFHSILEENDFQDQNITLELVHDPQTEDCVIFDPFMKNWSQDGCGSLRGAVCQFKKGAEVLDTFILPNKTFVGRPDKEHLMKSLLAEFNISSSWDGDLSELQHLTEGVLQIMESESSDSFTSSDVLHLTQIINLVLTTLPVIYTAGVDTAEVMVSVATNYLKLASLMLEPHTAAKWIGQTEDGVSVGPFTIVTSIDSLTEALAHMLSSEGRGFTLSTKNIVVYMVWQKLSEVTQNQIFKPSALGSHSSSSQDVLLIPNSELQRVHSLGYDEVMLIHTHYSRLNEILPAVEGEPQPKATRAPSSYLASAVISATMRDTSKAHTIPVAVHYTLSSSKLECSHQATPVCAFWNFNLTHNHASSWLSDGCTVTFADSDVTSCLCNHTTNFAVLINYMESKWSPEEELILTKLTFIGCSVSLCALVVTLMLFTVLDIPKSDRTSIHKNLFVALICAQVILLCSGSAIHNKVACTIVAALLHLFFMAAFSWMLVEGLLLWSKVVAVNLNENRHMKYYYLIGWGLPVLIVTITLASASGKYSADGYCWLSVQNGIIWGFVGPVIFIIMVNIMVLTRVVVITISTAKRRSFMLAMTTSPVAQAYEHMRAAVKAVLVLLPILGLTWLCGVLVPFSIVMAYIFIILNSLQGLFIFLIYGVYNTEVRSTVNRIKERRKALNFSNGASTRPSSSVTSSRPVSLPLGATTGHEEEAANPSYISSNALALDNEKERTRGQLPNSCAPERPENPLSHTSSKGIHQHRKDAPPTDVAVLPVGCSLHIPVELEFTTSCFPHSPAPQKTYGLLCFD